MCLIRYNVKHFNIKYINSSQKQFDPPPLESAIEVKKGNTHKIYS